MAKKKEIKKEPVYEKISTSNWGWDMVPIPEGATHAEAELDYSNCYYESDTPSCIIHFFKKKEG
jgi:hypothetical protein